MAPGSQPLFPSLSPTREIGGHSLLRGPLSRWMWRLFTQRLTRGGRWFIVPTIAFIAYGGISLQLQGYVPLAYAMGAWIIAAFAAIVIRPGVTLSAAHPERICVGETLQVELQVTRAGRAGAAAGELTAIAHRLADGIEALEDDGAAVPLLHAGESARVRLRLRCHKRGAYTLRGYRVESSFPFGLMRARQVFEDRRRLLVYPRFTPLTQLQLPTGLTYQPGGVALASQLGESFEYIGDREYRQGDNVRDIDWRATARLGRPIIREYREEYFMRVAVILDTHVPEPANATQVDSFERAVSVAASVSDYMARQDYLVDLFAAGPNLYHLTAGRSLAYLDQILDILACVQQSPLEPFSIIEPQIMESLSKITTVICVLLDWDERRRDFVQSLAEAGSAVKRIIVRDGDTTLPVDVGSAGPVPVISRANHDRGIRQL